MNDLMQELSKCEGEQRAFEAQTRQHEQAARDCDAKRVAAKLRVSELRANINDAKAVNFLETTALAAVKAREETEAAKTEIAAILSDLKQQKAALQELAKTLADLIEKATEKKPDAPTK